ncbi:hypothetical protein [Altererythrobacter sp. Root672]|uniref:hypothetical protein n=1 Tax=Altererythrobacter sp. Root672 TaxID=1736584 RepID=UPI000A745679|nr:hypothetical protein [Altererythrobacter sp. Root672]
MASVPFARGAERGEARFFFIMACLMVATILAGFSLNFLLGRSSLSSPLVVHAHGVVMLTWLGLYLLQNTLIFGGNIALHRRVGWLAAAWVPLVVAMGLLVMRHSMQSRGGPPFFDQNQFLISNPLQLFGFAGLTAWAISLRRNTSWHRRLMFCGMALLCGPGIGRLLPMPLFIPFAWYTSIFVPLVLFVGAGIIADILRYGRVHPAWFWGIGVSVVLQVIADLIAYSPAGYSITEWYLAGTPGAERPMAAFATP